MPDPDLQPPKPRAVSIVRWLLLLLPSVMILVTPTQIPSGEATEARIAKLVGTGLLNLAIAAVVSIVFGILLERWRRGSVEDGFRAFSYGLLIFFVNCLIGFTGCAVRDGAFNK